MMEGSANIECRALKAKMINGDSINVNAEHVSVDVMYGEHSVIQARDDITVGLLKGSIAVGSTDHESTLIFCVTSIIAWCHLTLCTAYHVQRMYAFIAFCVQRSVDCKISIKYVFPLQAHSESGNVSVSGIDGSFDLHADKGSIRLQINKLYPAPDYAMASRDRTGSHATAPEGHIAAVVDPEVRALY